MWEHIGKKIIKKTRKDHKCIFCGSVIPKNSPNIYYYCGKSDGNFQGSHVCNWCEKHMYELCGDDGYILDFWEALKCNIFGELFEKYDEKECECDSCEGVIESVTTRDYLIFECDECGEVYHREYMPVVEGEKKND